MRMAGRLNAKVTTTHSHTHGPLRRIMSSFTQNIIFSCHDHQLTQTVANRILELTDDGVVDRLCTYDEYVHLSELEGADESSD